MTLLGGFYGVARVFLWWLLWCFSVVVMVIAMMLLGCCNVVSRHCYGVARWLL